MHTKNPAAVALGKMARGRPKRYSAEERARRATHMREVQKIAVAKRKAKH